MGENSGVLWDSMAFFRLQRFGFIRESWLACKACLEDSGLSWFEALRIGFSWKTIFECESSSGHRRKQLWDLFLSEVSEPFFFLTPPTWRLAIWVEEMLSYQCPKDPRIDSPYGAGTGQQVGGVLGDGQEGWIFGEIFLATDFRDEKPSGWGVFLEALRY